MTQALNDAVHVARVGKILQTRHSVPVNAYGATECPVDSTNLPLLDGLHLRCTLGLVETQILSLAKPRAVLRSLTVALDGVGNPAGLQVRSRFECVVPED